MRLDVYKAGPIGTESVMSLELRAEQEIPEAQTLDQARRMYEAQGRSIAEALYQSLPGGTLDALLGHLLARRASLLRVRFTP